MRAPRSTSPRFRASVALRSTPDMNSQSDGGEILNPLFECVVVCGSGRARVRGGRFEASTLVAEGQHVVFVRQLRLDRAQRLHLQYHALASFATGRGGDWGLATKANSPCASHTDPPHPQIIPRPSHCTKISRQKQSRHRSVGQIAAAGMAVNIRMHTRVLGGEQTGGR
jgi:hypothetical protein